MSKSRLAYKQIKTTIMDVIHYEGNSLGCGMSTFALVLDNDIFEERDYFFFRCIFIGVTTEPVFDIRHKAHPTERMIVSYIGDSLWLIK